MTSNDLELVFDFVALAMLEMNHRLGEEEQIESLAVEEENE